MLGSSVCSPNQLEAELLNLMAYASGLPTVELKLQQTCTCTSTHLYDTQPEVQSKITCRAQTPCCNSLISHVLLHKFPRMSSEVEQGLLFCFFKLFIQTIQSSAHKLVVYNCSGMLSFFPFSTSFEHLNRIKLAGHNQHRGLLKVTSYQLQFWLISFVPTAFLAIWPLFHSVTALMCCEAPGLLCIPNCTTEAP